MFPTRLEQAEWRMIVELAAGLAVDEIITYQDLSELLERDFVNDGSKFNPAHRAIRELEEEYQMTLVNVPNVGYRVAHPREHEKLARHHYKKSSRQIGKSRSKIHSADRSKLTQEEAQRMDNMEMQLAVHDDFIKRLNKSAEKMHRVLEQNTKDQTTTNYRVNTVETEIDELQRRLRDLESEEKRKRKDEE
jgi:monoamine oxidase